MKYKAGDKVKVANRDALMDHKDVAYDMLSFADRIVTISDCAFTGYYFIKEDGTRYNWPEELLSFYTFYDESIKEQEELSLEDKIKSLEADVEKIDKKISRYREIARQKLEIKRILDDIEAGRTVTINDMSTSQLNLPDCSDFIRLAVAKALVDTSDELDRLEKEI